MNGREDDTFELPIQEVSAAIEALLFASGEPIEMETLSEVLNMDRNVIKEAMDKLISEYTNDPWGGLLIRRVDDAYVMCTKPGMKKVLERLFMPKSKPPLSQASYETLSVIAYNQPVTRAQVESVRGVSSDSIIARLLDRGWIREAGTLDAPGRPTLFETTQQFLLEFGIDSVDDLPSMELMSYKTIRDLEDSLEKAAGNDRQITIDNIIEQNQASAGTDDESENSEADNDAKYD